ncbi:MAG: 23S rRNA (adenine(2503)-C(2))-methyltransferase RlmN [Chloroflexi bacterium]|nr:23S rRNA (adenine(2503)-C(2))-methyltransferase RlmN [Chloroflexota bacterium]
MKSQSQSIFDLTKPELESYLLGIGQPRFRADQIWHWLYRALVNDPAQMHNLPRELQNRLAQDFIFQPVVEMQQIVSADQTTYKGLFRLQDGETVEAVLMLYDQRNTVCLSSQVGCAMGCAFCATGQMGFMRNLTVGEIVDQVLCFARRLATQNAALTNLVFMGMGEPLANYPNVWAAVERFHDPNGFNLGARRMTISTVGLVKGIRKLAEESLPVNLAVSLHAPDDALRQELIPVAGPRFPIAEIMAAVREYIALTNRRVTFEYALMRDKNDSPQQAQALADLLKGILCHVNLIPLNPTPGSPWQPTPQIQADLFREILTRNGIPATMRVRRGIEIQAGCGQLWSKVLKGENSLLQPMSGRKITPPARG